VVKIDDGLMVNESRHGWLGVEEGEEGTGPEASTPEPSE
jgi:hypothetical protein